MRNPTKAELRDFNEACAKLNELGKRGFHVYLDSAGVIKLASGARTKAEAAIAQPSVGVLHCAAGVDDQ